jgi:hypothetical protein
MRAAVPAIGKTAADRIHADLSTTQRYMHLSPAATEDAIRLLDERLSGVESAEKTGDILDTRSSKTGSA